MPEEIPHITYVPNDSYEVAVEKHIGKMLAIHQEAIRKLSEGTEVKRIF